MDIRTAPTAAPPHAETRRSDYRPPDWLVPEIALDFTLDPDASTVRTRLTVTRNGDHSRPLRLEGGEIAANRLKIDGAETAIVMDGSTLVIDLAGDRAVIESEVTLAPATNSKLMGLYASGGILCTQCESQGFRRIAFHPDRPDVLSVYTVRMSADAARFPILLANGNCTASGQGDDGTHWAEWHDPFPKPSYLFALVAGDLAANKDSFTTMSGRTVDLGIWVREADVPKTAHAMESLKAAMAWDERTYGREYDLSLFNIVAVDDFNFGAMENKGLNIFNSRYILADPDTATDADFDAIAAVVAHEYFHNWSGDRVTCRDWFQLSLKEGFTVFRDQSFSADMGSAAVKRIEDVRTLRSAQFPEDAGPLAHPVRPESYMEITNFYTATVYNKGAEVIRMMRTILGPDKFRAGSNLYFDRHDGQAVTCEDFVKAMEDASGTDLAHFRLWYGQAGTPAVTARLEQSPGGTTLHLAQTIPPTPGQPIKQPMIIPLRTALIGRDSGAELAPEQVILLDRAEQSIAFPGITDPAILSINRDFSAPIILDVTRAPGELDALAEHDPNPFARYEALQELMLRTLLAAANDEPADPAPVIESMRRTLASNALDPAFKGEALLLPSESLIGDRMPLVDPDAIHAARETLRSAIGQTLAEPLAAAQREGAAGHDLSSAAKGIRRLRTVALGLFAAGDPVRGAALAKAQFDAADNMTDRQGALSILVSLDAPERDAALAAFYDRYRGDSLVIDKWFGLQAAAQRRDTLAAVEALARHPDFSMTNPNRLRSLVGSFAMNQWAFHDASGAGYRFLTDTLLTVDRINPQTAAKLIPPLARWRRFEPTRAALMRVELERMLATPGLSKDLFEQVSKSLA